MSVQVDERALLCALVLAPRTFARNRFFSMYVRAPARRARSRAAELRGIVRHLAGHKGVRSKVRGISQGDGESTILRYGVPGLHLERMAVLNALEVSLVRFALWRALGNRAPGELAVTDEDRTIVERALSRLEGKHRLFWEHGFQPRSE